MRRGDQREEIREKKSEIRDAVWRYEVRKQKSEMWYTASEQEMYDETEHKYLSSLISYRVSIISYLLTLIFYLTLHTAPKGQ